MLEKPPKTGFPNIANRIMSCVLTFKSHTIAQKVCYYVRYLGLFLDSRRLTISIKKIDPAMSGNFDYFFLHFGYRSRITLP